MLSRSWPLLLAGSILARRSDIILPDLNFDFPVSQSPVQFNISVHQSFLDFTARKVRDYRPTRSFSDDWTLEGPPEKKVADVAEYWSTNYHWDAVEQRMNDELDHYATTVPGNGNYSLPIPLHFIHHRADKSDAIPLLLLHGWPSSYLEWSKVIKPLAQYPEQPFHIVAPDLPGFGFSPAPTGPGLGPREMGRAFDSLMHQLGYERYGIVTTDLGWFTGMWMVYDAQESILGHITDFFVVQPNATDRERLAKSEASREEIAYIAASDEWYTRHWAYASVHGQKPLALSLSLADSPVGFLGWYWDINHATSDGYQYSHEQLITDAMMLWIPGPYANIRAYLEVFKPDLMQFHKTEVPTGVSEWGWGHGPFPDLADFAFAPRSWIDRVAHLVYFKRHEFGGHFPAVTQPGLWVQDVREFFSIIQLQTTASTDTDTSANRDEL